ncbi:MAG: hypothetical protein ACRDRF_00705 [Pseudonocardiaceae bacterium]
MSDTGEKKAADNLPVSEPAPIPERTRTEGSEVILSAWKFPHSGWMLQLTADKEAAARSGIGYITLTLPGAANLWKMLGDKLREQGVIV